MPNLTRNERIWREPCAKLLTTCLTICATALALNGCKSSWTRSDESQDQACLEQARQMLDIVVSVAGYVASGEAASERLVAV